MCENSLTEDDGLRDGRIDIRSVVMNLWLPIKFGIFSDNITKFRSDNHFFYPIH